MILAMSFRSSCRVCHWARSVFAETEVALKGCTESGVENIGEIL